MKRTLFYALIFSALAAPALANPGGHAPDFDRVAERLGLDEAQTEQFSAAMQAQHERNQARIAPLREQMQQLRAEIQQETNATASGILTPEQMEKFERMQERRAQKRERRRDMRGQRRGRDDDQT
jgi:Spy/CpxP family protein refolding chaperone